MSDVQRYLDAARLRVLEVLFVGPSTLDELAKVCDQDKPWIYHLANVCGSALYEVDYSRGAPVENVTITVVGLRTLIRLREELSK